MEMIDSHTHWGPSVTMGIEVTSEELLRQAEQSGKNKEDRGTLTYDGIEA